MRKSLILLTTIFAIISLACTITLPNIPTAQPGEIMTVDINEAYPSTNDAINLTISMGAGKLNIQPGADSLAQGTVRFNIPQWQPEITRNDQNITLDQTAKWKSVIPTGNVINEWNLKLGNQKPLDLVIKAGAYDGMLDLGGIPLTRLEISDGASNANVNFSSPNPTSMTRLYYKTGASSVKLSGLGNANFNEMTFEGGAGSYSLDFSGQLRQAGRVEITGGVSATRIIIPATMNSVIKVSGGLNNVTINGTWTANNGSYSTNGPGPLLTIQVDLGVGSLNLIHNNS